MIKHLGIALFVVLTIAAVAAFFALDLSQDRFLDILKSSQDSVENYYRQRPFQSVALYFGIYVIVASLSLPGAAALTIAGGAMFGFVLGTVLVSFASAIGATVAFLISRHVLRDWFRTYFRRQFDAMNRGVEEGGALYLFCLRLVPALPYVVTNMGMGLTTMRVPVYYWTSQLGMLAGTIVYVNAGTRLGELESIQGIMSVGMIASFALLALFPLAARAVSQRLSKRMPSRNEQNA